MLCYNFHCSKKHWLTYIKSQTLWSVILRYLLHRIYYNVIFIWMHLLHLLVNIWQNTWNRTMHHTVKILLMFLRFKLWIIARYFKIFNKAPLCFTFIVACLLKLPEQSSWIWTWKCWQFCQHQGHLTHVPVLASTDSTGGSILVYTI